MQGSQRLVQDTPESVTTPPSPEQGPALSGAGESRNAHEGEVMESRGGEVVIRWETLFNARCWARGTLGHSLRADLRMQTRVPRTPKHNSQWKTGTVEFTHI